MVPIMRCRSARAMRFDQTTQTQQLLLLVTRGGGGAAASTAFRFICPCLNSFLIAGRIAVRPLFTFPCGIVLPCAAFATNNGWATVFLYLASGNSGAIHFYDVHDIQIDIYFNKTVLPLSPHSNA